MSNLRIIQKKLLYVIGLSSNLAFKDTQLSKFEFFGQYGKILKLVVNKNKTYNVNGPNGPSYSAYVTYSTPEECSLAILSLENTTIEGHLLRASYGTTKYCSNFLKSVECHNKECLYLHYFADESDILEREDMNTNKSIFYSQHFLAMELADIFNEPKKQKLIAMKNNKTIFPSPHTIYNKENVIEEMNKRVANVKEVVFNQDSNINFKYNPDTIPNVRYPYARLKSGESIGDSSTCSSGNTCNSCQAVSQCNTCKSGAPIFKARAKSRFNFADVGASPELDENVAVPEFVHDLISKNTSRFSLRKKLYKDDESLTYFCDYHKSLLREYNENNQWARFIISHNGDKVKLEKLAADEENLFVKKFKTG